MYFTYQARPAIKDAEKNVQSNDGNKMQDNKRSEV